MLPRDYAIKEFYRDCPVLVTGGAGFIGSHIVEELVALGARVTVFDDFSSGSRENLAHVMDHITIIEGSICNTELCHKATLGNKVVFHLAAFISVPDSIKNPALCYATNVVGTINLLEACRHNHVERFVLSSSAAVYGSGHTLCTEDASLEPESPYGTSKLIGELLCKQYARNFGLKTVCLRYFNVYGERQNPNGAYAAVVAKFRHHMRHNEPITIFGTGMQTRDFIPVHQVASANLTLALLADTHMNGQAFNIATGTSITLLDLIDSLKQEFPQYTQEIRYAAERAGDIRTSRADCHKFKHIITTIGQRTI